MKATVPKLFLALMAFAFVATLDVRHPGGTPAAWAVSGGSFTTFDATQGGCLDNHTGIDCNNYASKDDVYVSGGPPAGGLADGCYYFTVLAPGFQNGGFIDGANGNLSDTTSSNGGSGSGDPSSNRTFHVTDGVIDQYSGTHHTGTSTVSTGSESIIQLSPYDNTPNPGGVYILAVCQCGATSPSQCKYDAFRVPPSGGPPPPPLNVGEIQVCKYYDANVSGTFDGADSSLSGWPFQILPTKDGAPENQIQTTDNTGCVTWTNLDPGVYTIQEGIPSQTNWFNSDPSCTVFPPNAACQTPIQLVPNTTIITEQATVTAGNLTAVDFGNFCEVPSGGRTLGFWSNKNGQALLTQADFNALTNEPLVGANCSQQNFTGTLAENKTTLHDWLLDANAVNMAYELSVQLAATKLDVRHHFVSGTAFDLCSGETINDLILEADAALSAVGGDCTIGASDARTNEERLKDCLDAINNGAPVVPPNACAHSGFTFPVD